jgi:molecular chaperone DnaK
MDSPGSAGANPGVLAIDFGTTNSYFCKCPADQISPVGVDFGTGRDGLPTAILYRNGPGSAGSGKPEPLIGDAALHEYGEASPAQRKHYVLRTQFKPDIVHSSVASDAATDFLRTVVEQSRRRHIILEPDKQHVIFGVPSEAQGSFKTKLAQIAEAAGYGEVTLLDEPKGALLHHLWHKDFSPQQARKGILVVDFGGGTCDFALLDNLHVRQSWGDMELGGRWFDDLFFQWFIEQNPNLLREIEDSGDAYFVHSYLCREVKEFFSLTMARDRSETVNKSVGRYGSLRGMTWSAFLDRAHAYRPSRTYMHYLQDMNAERQNLASPLSTDKPTDLIGWFRDSLARGFAQDQAANQEVSRVILAGGSSQWPFVADIVCEVLNVETSSLMRSDRPYAVIAQGLAILPALQKTFAKTRENLRNDLPRFCAERVNPLIDKVTDRYVATVAGDVTSELFDEIVRPVLAQFRENGGSVNALKQTISAQVQAKEDRLRDIIENKMQTLYLGLPAQLNELLKEWFGSYGLHVGDGSFDESHRSAFGSKMIDAKAPDLYGSIMEAVGWIVVALVASVGAMVSGGAGTALLVSGPLGLLIGAFLSAVVAFLAVRYGKAKALELANDWNAPAWIVKTALTPSRIAKTREQFNEQLQDTLRREIAVLHGQLEQRIADVTQQQIESLSEITQL